MTRVETLERRIKTYQRELRKLRLQLKIAKIDEEDQQQNDKNRGIKALRRANDGT